MREKVNVFISQPMTGLTENDILLTRAKEIRSIYKFYNKVAVILKVPRFSHRVTSAATGEVHTNRSATIGKRRHNALVYIA